MRAYIIRQGDHLEQLAATMGFDADEVWNHERNRELRELRRDPAVLAPGDVLYIPEPQEQRLTLRAKTTNRYEATIRSVRIDTVLTFGGAEPLADVPYEVRGNGPPVSRRTDRRGRARFEIPAHLREVRLFLPEQNLEAVLQVGHLNPVDARGGLETRLANLGYGAPTGLLPVALTSVLPAEERAQEATRALQSFQTDHGMDASGVADDDTNGALVDEHGR